MKILVLKRFALILTGLCISMGVSATDGYFSLGYGTVNKGLAGAGVGFYQGSLINGNPAALSFLGNQYHVGVSFFNPNRQFTVTGNPSQVAGTFGLLPGTVESDSKLFVIPSAGANWMLNDKSSFGVSIFGNGGMNTDYPTASFYDPTSTTTGVNLAQLFANLSYSIKLGEKHSLGLSGVLSYQYFEAKGLTALGAFSSNAQALSNNDVDNSFGVGFKIGYFGYITEQLSVGASYQSKVYMSEFDDYAGLFAEQGDFDIPASWTVGFAWNITDDFTLMGDVKQIMYSDIKAIANPMLPNLMTARLGDDAGAGFGWEDIMVYKIGLNYSGVDTWVFRAGFSMGENPVPESEVLFNILAPGVVENHLALGFSKDVGNNQIHLAINYAMNNTVKGMNMLDPPASQTIELEMNQLEIELGFSF